MAAQEQTYEWLDEIERAFGLDSTEMRAALKQRGLVVLDKPAKTTYCWCLVPKGYPFGGHTGVCCSVHMDCDLPMCFCDCPDPDEGPYSGYERTLGAMDGDSFADPGGRSALRAATHDRCPTHGCHAKVRPSWSWCPQDGTRLNPRKHPCPSCRAPGVLTDADVQLGYQCDACADRAEGRYVGGDY